MDEKGPSYLKIGGKVLYRLEYVRLYELSCRIKTAASSRQIQAIKKIWHGDGLAIEVRKQPIDFIGYFSWSLFFIPARDGNIAVFEKMRVNEGRMNPH